MVPTTVKHVVGMAVTAVRRPVQRMRRINAVIMPGTAKTPAPVRILARAIRHRSGKIRGRAIMAGDPVVVSTTGLVMAGAMPPTTVQHVVGTAATVALRPVLAATRAAPG